MTVALFIFGKSMTYPHCILSLLLLTAPLILYSTTVTAIKCWTCQSNVDPKCADPFDNSTLPITDCDAYVREDLAVQSSYESLMDKEHYLKTFEHLNFNRRPRFCRKIRQKVKGDWRTIRGCAYLGEIIKGDENNCIMRQGR